MSISAETIGKEKLEELIDKISNVDKKDDINQKILNKIGVAWSGNIRNNIYKGVDFNGRPLLKPKNREGKSLLDTGNLVSRINFRVENSDTLKIASNAYYSRWLNDGTEKMEARPFIPTNTDKIPKTWWNVANKIALKIMKDELL